MSAPEGQGLPEALVRDAANRLARVRARIDAACRSAGRAPAEVTLIGASKRQSIDRIAATVWAGLTQLGENYVQEARDKRPALEARLAAHAAASGDARALPAPRWRMIGHLQRNKARQAIPLFDHVDTVDRLALARALDKRIAEVGAEPLDICLQVNVSGEPQKSGAPEAEIPSLLAGCAELHHIRVVGLMTVPESTTEAETTRAAFARLRTLRDTLHLTTGGELLSELSMGMSGDLEIAVEEGATLVRVGTDLFGDRPPAS